jgi:ABC-type uncharacterized transport system involved in gliding motility auxiliary subunit
MARSVTPAQEEDAGRAGSRTTVLVQTSLEGYGETNLRALPDWQRGDDDTQGPVALVVAVEGRAEASSPVSSSDAGTGPENLADGPQGPEPTEALAGGSGLEAPQEEPEARPFRLVVVGNSSFASNRLLGSLANATFVSNLFNWLVERQALLGIPAKEPEHVRLSLTGDQVRNLHLLVLLLLPGLAVATGIWMRRLRRR